MTNPNAAPVATPPLSPRATTPRRRGQSRLLDIALLSRSRRRKLIREIEAATGRTLLCYVSLGPSIAPSDTYNLDRLLQSVDAGTSITLLLDSPGGDVDSAEKMIHLLSQVCQPLAGPEGDLEVVIPYQAKSAATLIALGSDRIVMSDSSELGAIDPQVQFSEGYSIPALALLRAYEKAVERCMAHPNNDAFARQLEAFSPEVVEVMQLAVMRSQACAERLLKRKGVNYTAVAAILVDVERFPSHGQMIDWRMAQDIGIPDVHPLDRHSSLWRQYWRLYRQLSELCGVGRRVFESRDLTIVTR